MILFPALDIRARRTPMVQLSTSRTQTAVTFFREFLREPAMVGSIIPTSRVVVNGLLDGVDWDKCRLFVEYGPGLGTFTHDILARLHPQAQLIAIDTNPRFIAHLQRTISDLRFTAVNGSAADVQDIITAHGHKGADYVISGLPFSTLPAGIGPAIMAATHAALNPGGAFVIYQYSRFVLPLLRAHFQRIDQALIWRNIPPCRTFFAWKD
jgi:phospholipid N-methyltransferase